MTAGSTRGPGSGLRADALWLALCCIFGMAASLALNHCFAPPMFGKFAPNVWFQADLERTVANMVDRHSDQWRTAVHPIVSLITLPLTAVLGWLWPGDDYEVASRLTAIAAGLWSAGCFRLSRLLDNDIPTSLAFVLLATGSAAFVFWFSVPETYGLGSLTILACLLVAAGRPSSEQAEVRRVSIASALSLSITVTNWMVGLALAAAVLPLRRAVRATLVALSSVAVLALVQKVVAPTSRLFFLGTGGGEPINPAGTGSAWDKVWILLTKSMATTRPVQIAGEPAPWFDKLPYWPCLSVQHQSPSALGAWGGLLVAGWLSLIALGAYSAVRDQAHRRLAIVLALTILGQFGLHAVYGEETFLYVLNIVPLLLCVALFVSRGPYRRWAAPAFAILGIAASIHNIDVFRSTIRSLEPAMNQRDQAITAMSARPDVPWPRGRHHIVLGVPDAAIEEKAYVEPAGAVSPAPASFGVSVWVTDKNGRLLATSDTTPEKDIAQQLAWDDDTGAPTLSARTALFNTEVSIDRDGTTRLTLRRKSPDAAWFVLRSVGPAGGPLRRIVIASQQRVQAGDDWTLEAQGASAVHAADESTGGIVLEGREQTVSSERGWGYAVLRIDQPVASITMRRSHAAAGKPSAVPERLWRPVTPSEEFNQLAALTQMHLLMQTASPGMAPGDGLDFDDADTRATATAAVALARAGQSTIAMRLGRTLASRDFMAVRGVEFDALGMALWALDEVSATEGDDARREFWPSVQRKAAYVERCIAADQDIHATWSSNVDTLEKRFVPDFSLLCRQARNGLPSGKVDSHVPVLYSGASAYMALVKAAALAPANVPAGDAERWLRTAHDIRAAWNQSQAQAASRSYVEIVRHGATDLAHEARQMGMRRIGQAWSAVRPWLAPERDMLNAFAGPWPSDVLAPEARPGYLDWLQRAHPLPDRGPMRQQFAWAHQWLLAGDGTRAAETVQAAMAGSQGPHLGLWTDGTGKADVGSRRAGVRPARPTSDRGGQASAA